MFSIKSSFARVPICCYFLVCCCATPSDATSVCQSNRRSNRIVLSRFGCITALAARSTLCRAVCYVCGMFVCSLATMLPVSFFFVYDFVIRDLWCCCSRSQSSHLFSCFLPIPCKQRVISTWNQRNFLYLNMLCLFIWSSFYSSSSFSLLSVFWKCWKKESANKRILFWPEFCVSGDGFANLRYVFGKRRPDIIESFIWTAPECSLARRKEKKEN